jgi:hypothetical protein
MMIGAPRAFLITAKARNIARFTHAPRLSRENGMRRLCATMKPPHNYGTGYGKLYPTDMVGGRNVRLWVAALMSGVVAAQLVTPQYEIGQELGFSSRKSGGQEETESMVTPEVLDRLRREAATGKKGRRTCAVVSTFLNQSFCAASA